MNRFLSVFFFLAFVVFSGFQAPEQDSHVEFTCMKMHKASNTCHFNFKVDGAKYRYVDIGCKFSKKTDELVKKVKEGTLFLSKDWKIECPEPQPKKEGSF